MDNTTTLIRHVLRDDTIDPLVAEGVRYALWFARRVWFKTDLVRIRAADASDEAIAEWRSKYTGKRFSQSLFASYMSYEDLQGDMLLALVKIAKRFVKKPSEEQTNFIAYLREGLINHVRGLYRWARRHDDRTVESFDALQASHSEDIMMYGGPLVEDQGEVDLSVSDDDPLKKRTEDVAKHVDEEVYAFEFLRTLNDRQRTIIQIQMEDLTLSDRKIGLLLNPPISQSTVYREKRLTIAKLILFDPERLPQWLVLLREDGGK